MKKNINYYFSEYYIYICIPCENFALFDFLLMFHLYYFWLKILFELLQNCQFISFFRLNGLGSGWILAYPCKLRPNSATANPNNNLAGHNNDL
jgi:hypothetical protein